MLEKLWNRFRNRRKDGGRVMLHLQVKTADPDGNLCHMVSEDISDRGIRLRIEQRRWGEVLGHREEVALEIGLPEEKAPIVAQAQLMWAFNSQEGVGGTSGWRFVHFRGNARRRLRHFLEPHIAEKQEA
ncbi:MAG: PilZ domain-containing protein [bacterium]|nr:PilZ domain-containing protein [bacterium]